MSLVLYQYWISPYCGKVRSVLRYKGLAYEPRLVSPVNKLEVLRVSGQRRVPILKDGRRVVVDSSEIVRYLESRFPDPPVYPRSRRDRAQALLWEDWADEALQRVVGPLKFLHRGNARRMAALEAAQQPERNTERTWRLINPAIVFEMVTFGQTRSVPRLLNRLEEQAQILADRLEGKFLVGDTPTIADFAVHAVLEPFEGLYGWSTLEQHEKIMRWYRRVGDLGAGNSGAAPDATPIH